MKQGERAQSGVRGAIGIHEFATAANTLQLRGLPRLLGRAMSHRLPLVLRVVGHRSG